MGKVVQPETLMTRFKRIEQLLAALRAVGGPYLPWRTILASELAGVAVTANTPTDTHRLYGLRVNRFLSVRVKTSTSLTDTTGWVQVIDAAGALTPVLVQVPYGDPGTERVLRIEVTGDYLTEQAFKVQAWVADGTGAVSVAVLHAEGVPS